MEGAIVGKRARVLDAANPLHAGIEGMVEDETQNMVMIRGNDGKTRSIPKKGTQLSLGIGGGHVAVSGNELLGKPENRGKKK